MWQVKTFKKFFKNEYEFVVFSDASDEKIARKIKITCDHLGVRHIRIPQTIHTKPYLPRPKTEYQSPSYRTADAIQYSLDTLGFKHNDLVMIIDSDMFLIRDFNLREYMQGYDLAGAFQYRGNHNEIKYIERSHVFKHAHVAK